MMKPQENPIAWLLGGLLVFALYGSYSTGNKLTEVCRLAAEPLDWSTGTAALFTADGSPNIDGLLSENDRLRAEDSLQGDVWRWQHGPGATIQKICSSLDDGDFNPDLS